MGLDGQGPLYRQLYRGFCEAILGGRLPAGSRLPSTRAVAHEHGCSRNVVLLAYDLLQSEGYIEGRAGSGTYIAIPPFDVRRQRDRDRPARASGAPPRLSRFGARVSAKDFPSRVAPADPPLPFDFRYGVVDVDDITRTTWRRLVHARSRQPAEEYLAPEGHPDLRKALADYLGRARGMSLDPRNVIVVNGSQQALDLTARVFVDEGDAVLIEEPGYGGARSSFAAAGARLVPMPVLAAPGDGGIPVAARGAKLAYVTPSHQFPLGHVMPVGARLALLAWARANGTYIVEDDYDSEYRYDGPPLEAVHALDREGRTIYVGTLSKVLFPALRLGYLVVPDALVSVFARAKWLADRHTPALLQLALADFIREGHFERHLRRARKQNAARRALLLEELRRHLGDRVELQGENAGVHVVVWLRHLSADRLDRLLAGARTRGVGVYSVASYYAKPPNRQGLMLGFSALGRQAIREGVRRFAEAYREVVETRVRGRMTGEVVPGTARKVAL